MTGFSAPFQYQQAATDLDNIFCENSLELNITKTEELCSGARSREVTSPCLSQPLSTRRQLVEQVQSFRYQGTEIDTCWSSTQYTDAKHKTAQQRPHLLESQGLLVLASIS